MLSSARVRFHTQAGVLREWAIIPSQIFRSFTDSHCSRLSGGAIGGIVGGICTLAIVTLVLLFLCLRQRRRKRSALRRGMLQAEFTTGDEYDSGADSSTGLAPEFIEISPFPAAVQVSPLLVIS